MDLRISHFCFNSTSSKKQNEYDGKSQLSPIHWMGLMGAHGGSGRQKITCPWQEAGATQHKAIDTIHDNKDDNVRSSDVSRKAINRSILIKG